MRTGRRGPLRMRVSHGLGIFVATYNGETIKVAVAIAIIGLVDEILSTTRPGIGDVGYVGIGHVRSGGGLIVPCTPTCAKATHRVTVGSEDEKGRIGIVTSKVVHEPCSCALNLGLRGSGGYRGCVYPCPRELAFRIRNMCATTAAARRADRDALAILRVNIIPGTSADIVEEVRYVGLCLGAGITAC